MNKLFLILLFTSPLIAMEKKPSTDRQTQKTKKKALTEYQEKKLKILQETTEIEKHKLEIKKEKLELLEKQARNIDEILLLQKINLHINQIKLLSNHPEDLPPEATAYLAIAIQDLFDYKYDEASDTMLKKINNVLSKKNIISIETEDSITPPCGVHWNEQFNVQNNNNIQ